MGPNLNEREREGRVRSNDLDISGEKEALCG